MHCVVGMVFCFFYAVAQVEFGLVYITSGGGRERGGG